MDEDMKQQYSGLYHRGCVLKQRAAAIRLKCLDCSGWNIVEVKQCVIKDCPLYPFRVSAKSLRTIAAASPKVGEEDNDDEVV